MSGLKVTYSKLEKYCKENGGYDLTRLNGQVNLSFAPTFPEAVEKGDSTAPKITMIGTVKGDTVNFSRVEIEDETGQHVREQKEAELVYRSWLDFIEENF